eukprot:Pgem_evm2s908
MENICSKNYALSCVGYGYIWNENQKSACIFYDYVKFPKTVWYIADENIGVTE